MQFKSLAISALFAGALAAPEVEKRQAGIPASVLQVLQTAVPTSIALEFLTNSAGVYQSIGSELAVGSTPSWIAALPTGVQSYLVGLAGDAGAVSSASSAVSSAVANITSSAGAALVTSRPNGTAIAGNGTAGNVTSSLLGAISSANSSLSSAIAGGNGTGFANMTGAASRSASRSGSASASASGSTTASRSGSASRSAGAGGASASGTASQTGGASLPTALGMGLAGAVGLVGVFVL